MPQTSLSFDQRIASIPSDAQHKLLGGAGDEIRDGAIDDDALARDQRAGLAGRDELAAVAQQLMQTADDLKPGVDRREDVRTKIVGYETALIRHPEQQ